MTNQLKKVIKFFLWIPYKILKKVTDRLLSPLYERLDLLDMKINREIVNTDILIKYATGLANRGERYLVTNYWNIEPVHTARYQMAGHHIKENDKVLDIACGSGYGSSYLNDYTKASSIIGVDLDPNIIEYAKKFFEESAFVWIENRIQFLQGNISDTNLFSQTQFDAIVSFETIEHLPDGLDVQAIKNISQWLKPEGTFISSVPDYTLIPYDRDKKNFSPFHFRHYTKDEYYKLLQYGEFSEIQIGYINMNDGFVQEEHTKECFRACMVAICKK